MHLFLIFLITTIQNFLNTEPIVRIAYYILLGTS